MRAEDRVRTEAVERTARSGGRGWRARRELVEARREMFQRRNLGRLIGGALSLGIFLLSIFVMARVVANLDISALRQAVAATSAEQIAAAIGLTALSYLALTGYDALALRHIRAKVPYRVTSLASFTSYAISFTLGFPLITGGTVRYWIYSRAGLTAAKVASLTVIAGITFWAGMAFVIGAALILRAEAISHIVGVSAVVNAIVGAGVLGAIAAYLLWVAAQRRRVRIRGFRLQLPGAWLSLGQITLGVIDLCAAAGVLYVLLPASVKIDFATFAATYVFGCVLGIASHAPGGIGVFEATIIKFVPGASEAALLASLLLFRIIYYLGPFVFALALLGADEALRRWKGLREAMERREAENGADD